MIERLQTNLAKIEERINAAATKSGRTGSDITLVGVTKYVDADVTKALFVAGCSQLGESRPQALWEKAATLSDCEIVWHMIGHLQRNKVKRTIECAELIHSVDSLRLIDAIDNAAHTPVKVLLEINVSGEPAKHGFTAEQLPIALKAVAQKERIDLLGLMCMAGLAGDLDDARREFASLRILRDQHQDFGAANVDLRELSMGMSRDFEAAIEEGATIVRIGSSLFEGIL